MQREQSWLEPILQYLQFGIKQTQIPMKIVWRLSHVWHAVEFWQREQKDIPHVPSTQESESCAKVREFEQDRQT